MAQQESLDEELAALERRVAAGETDRRALGFSSFLRRVKRDPEARERLAERVGAVDRRLFEARKRVIPIPVGLTILLAQTIVLAAVVPVALALARGMDRPRPGLAGLLLVGAAVGLSVSVHGPAHWIAGRTMGMRFVGWFLGGPFRIQPGLKVDQASYLRADPTSRAAMHAAGAIASKVAPFAVFGVAYVQHARAGWELVPEWSLWAILGFGALQIVTDVVWSTRRSDWMRVRRELRIARAEQGAVLSSRGDPGSSGQPG